MATVIQTLVGNLTEDVELKTTNGGRVYTRFRVATNERYRASDGEWTQRDACFWNIEAWGDLAQSLAAAFRKGSPIILTGPTRTQNWQNEAGERRSRMFVKVEAFGPNLAAPRREDDQAKQVASEAPETAEPVDEWAAQV